MVKQKYANGYYEGDVVKGERQGVGTYYWNSGNKYQGAWEGGDMHGYGVYYYANGCKYAGDFRFNDREGRGVYTFADGSYYDGEFAHDTMCGEGVYRYADGDSYKGNIENGRFEGYGIYHWKKGDWYEGLWSKGVIHGAGTYHFANGSWVRGNFENNRLVSAQQYSKEQNVVQKKHSSESQTDLPATSDVTKNAEQAEQNNNEQVENYRPVIEYTIAPQEKPQKVAVDTAVVDRHSSIDATALSTSTTMANYIASKSLVAQPNVAQVGRQSAFAQPSKTDDRQSYDVSALVAQGVSTETNLTPKQLKKQQKLLRKQQKAEQKARKKLQKTQSNESSSDSSALLAAGIGVAGVTGTAMVANATASSAGFVNAASVVNTATNSFVPTTTATPANLVQTSVPSNTLSKRQLAKQNKKQAKLQAKAERKAAKHAKTADRKYEAEQRPELDTMSFRPVVKNNSSVGGVYVTTGSGIATGVAVQSSVAYPQQAGAGEALVQTNCPSNTLSKRQLAKQNKKQAKLQAKAERKAAKYGKAADRKYEAEQRPELDTMSFRPVVKTDSPVTRNAYVAPNEGVARGLSMQSAVVYAQKTYPDEVLSQTNHACNTPTKAQLAKTLKNEEKKRQKQLRKQKSKGEVATQRPEFIASVRQGVSSNNASRSNSREESMQNAVANYTSSVCDLYYSPLANDAIDALSETQARTTGKDKKTGKGNIVAGYTNSAYNPKYKRSQRTSSVSEESRPEINPDAFDFAPQKRSWFGRKNKKVTKTVGKASNFDKSKRTDKVSSFVSDGKTRKR